MIDEIKKKVKDNPFCDLSIAELIELSKLSYNELVDIFGKNFVAHTQNEITIDTICYVGNLTISRELPTYNLKYIFGNFNYNLDKIQYLENLCFISKSFTIIDDYYEPELSDFIEIFENEEFILYAIRQENKAFQYASYDLKNDKKFILEVIKNNIWNIGNVLNYVSKDILDDREFVLEAVKINGMSLDYASKRLKKDKEVVIEAVKQNGMSLIYASDELRKDKEVVIVAVKQNGNALRYTSDEIKNDKEIVLEAVKENGKAIKYVSDDLKNDIEVVFEAVKQNNKILSYVSENLKNDRDFILDVEKIHVESSGIKNKY